MIIDTSFIQEFNAAEQAKTYKELIAICKTVPSDIFKKMNIYNEKHEVTPWFEAPYAEKINLPLSVHFIAHILRARESVTDKFRIGNYTEAYKIMNNPISAPIRSYYESLIEEAGCYHQKWYKPDYDILYGKKSDRIKDKLRQAAVDIYKRIGDLRNESIKRYAQSRPESHNQNISRGRMKAVNYNGVIYNNASECSEATGMSVSKIRRICQKKQKLMGQLMTYVPSQIHEMPISVQENHEIDLKKILDKYKAQKHL